MLKKKITKIVTLMLVCIMSLGIIACDNNTKEKEDNSQAEISKEEERKKAEEDEKAAKRKVYEDELSKVYYAFDKSDNKGAINICTDLVTKVEDPYEAYALRGYAKAMNGNFDEAMKDIDKALEINPNYGRGRHYKAFTYKLFKKNDKALEWFIKSVEAEEYSWSYFGAACIYSVKNDKENAIKYLKKAVELEPEAIKARAKTEEDFNNIKNSKEYKELMK